MTSTPKPPEFFIKTGLSVEPIATNEELWATGLVASLWTIIETIITEYGDALTSYDARSKKRFHGDRGTRRRVRLLRVIVRRHVLPQYVPLVIDFCDRISSMQQQRDRIIHGMWGETLPKPDEDAGPPYLHEIRPNLRPFKWQLTYEDIFNVARRIDALITDMLMFKVALMQPTDQRSSHDALRRILWKPNLRLRLFGRLPLPLPSPLARLLRRGSSP